MHTRVYYLWGRYTLQLYSTSAPTHLHIKVFQHDATLSHSEKDQFNFFKFCFIPVNGGGKTSSNTQWPVYTNEVYIKNGRLAFLTSKAYCLARLRLLGADWLFVVFSQNANLLIDLVSNFNVAA